MSVLHRGIPLGRHHRAFTLSEVLLALVLLGIIAAVTIPKILLVQADQQRKLVFKETYGTLADVLYSGGVSGGYTSTQASFISYILDHVNSIKTCPTNAADEGCWNIPPDPIGESAQAGYIAPNGAVVIGLALFDYAVAPGYGPPSYGYGNGLIIDWNGAAGPNQYGKDWLSLFYCADTIMGLCSNPHTNFQPVKMGYLSPEASDIAQQQLFAQIMQ